MLCRVVYSCVQSCVRFCRVLQGFVKCCRVLYRVVEFGKVVWSFVKNRVVYMCVKIGCDLWYFWIFLIKYHEVLQSIAKYCKVCLKYCTVVWSIVKSCEVL